MARERKFSKAELFGTTRDLLLTHGYEGFNFSMLAGELDVARGTIYKYYENKEELITEFMIVEMDEFLTDLNQLDDLNGFDAKFDHLLRTMYKHSKIRKILIMANRVLDSNNEKVKVNKKQFEKQHIEMYRRFQTFLESGRKEKLLKSHIPHSLLLGFIFQSIETLNYIDMQQSEWVESMKELLSHGMFTLK